VNLPILVLALIAALHAPGSPQPPSIDAELERGIGQVRQGEFEMAVVTLDAVVRRLSAEPGRSKDLARATVYLSIADFGLGRMDSAKARFLEAHKADKGLSISTKEFPPNIVEFFTKTLSEAAEPASSPAPPTPSPAAAAAPSELTALAAALPAIRSALDAESREVRDAATQALMKCCPAEALQSSNPRVRQRAVSELALASEGEGVLEALIQPALSDPDRLVRTSATNALMRVGPRAATLLADRVTRRDAAYKQALQILVDIGPPAFRALEEALKKARSANDEPLAAEIAQAISQISTGRR
jgi:hypothetical protein